MHSVGVRGGFQVEYCGVTRSRGDPSAFTTPELLRPGGALDMSLGNVRLLAGVLAAGVAWRTKNVLLTIGVGMVALWVLQGVIPR